MSKSSSCLSPLRFGFAFGLIWGLGLLLLGWSGWLFAYGLPWIRLMGTVYLGFHPTFIGGIIGAIWGFVDFFIFGLLVALVYNACCCAGKGCGKQQSDNE